MVWAVISNSLLQLDTLITANLYMAKKNGFHIHKLVLMLNLILIPVDESITWLISRNGMKEKQKVFYFQMKSYLRGEEN